MTTLRCALVAILASPALLGIAAAQSDRESGDREPAGRTSATAANQSKAISSNDFASQAAVISKAEIELGQLALKVSNDDDVKKFAKRMVTDHTASSQKLQTVAAKDQIALPKSLDAEHVATKEKLASLEGEAFDREYMKAMSKGHDKAVALFESASQNTQLPSDLKQFAASTLPTLREHREMSHQLHTQQQ